MSALADRYEKLYPGTGITESHKEERMQRELFKEERLALRRTGRNRGVIIPASPAFDHDGRLKP
jgi:hypothetical protein